MARAAFDLADSIRNDTTFEGVATSRSVLNDIFEMEPVPLDVFVTDKAYLNNPELSKVQYDAVRHLEQIYLRETYPLMVEEWGDYWKPYRWINFAWLQWGKGSGKDHVCRVSSARIAYLLMCLKSPQDYFGMPAQDYIHTLNVAASSTQAHRAFFRPLRTLVTHAPIFKDRAEPKEYSIQFDKQIEAVSGHSLAETMEGLNIMLGIADEISAFKTKEEVERHVRTAGGREPAKTAESILKMMRTSARTRFPQTFKIAAISYPRFKGDAIQQLCARGEEDNRVKGEASRTYVSGPFATWEVNPRVSSRDDFEEDYDEDPEMARGMYECKPSLSTNRFFRNDLAVKKSFSRVVDPEPLEVEYYWGRDETTTDDEKRDGWQVRFHINGDELIPYRGPLYVMHGDMALTGDRAGVALCHVRDWQREEWAGIGGEVVEPRPIVKVDFVTAFEADLTAEPEPREIQIRWFRKLVMELTRRGFYIALATFDQFQSADTIQILTARGIDSKRLSVDRGTQVWNTLRDVMYDGRLEGYMPPLGEDEMPIVVEELLTLARLPNGKVDHPQGGSKDEADALAGAVQGAVELGGTEGESPERADIPMEGSFSISSGWGGGSDIGFGLPGGFLSGDLAPPTL